jgi:predicted CXXCH cytochrome family protein
MTPWRGFLVVLFSVVLIAAIAIGMLVWRGFRATSEPSAFERKVARTVRNWAIPRTARDQKNPLQITPETLHQGREIFLAQCATCHSYVDNGVPQIGRALYPRAPDLRSSITQALTDGEIHYIIENGVQLTGMPAWKNIDTTQGDGPWQLVLFIRSLRPLSAQEQVQQASTAASAHYVGSLACRKCHEEIFDRWQKTPMANVVRDPRQHPEAIIPDLATNPIAKFTKEDVAFVYGSLWKQRYFTKIGDDYYPEPAQWDVATHQWLKYSVPQNADWWVQFYPPDNMQRPTGPTCDGCHSVDYNVHTKQVAEWNVGCERCHGPGSTHADHSTRDNIVNPAHLEYVAGNDTCISCHSQGRPTTIPNEDKYYDWAVGYRVGLRLRNFWRLEEHTLGQTTFTHFPDGTAHKNRMQGNDFVQSVMYTRGITCFTCHDVHGTNNYAQLRKPADKLCLDCHGPLSPNGPRTATLEEHTHHKTDSAGSQCIACHMPKIETEGVPLTFVRSHTFRFITPRMTDKYQIPNPCTTCHTDKDTAWAIRTMNSWTERSPWRLE